MSHNLILNLIESVCIKNDSRGIKKFRWWESIPPTFGIVAYPVEVTGQLLGNVSLSSGRKTDHDDGQGSHVAAGCVHVFYRNISILLNNYISIHQRHLIITKYKLNKLLSSNDLLTLLKFHCWFHNHENIHPESIHFSLYKV